MHDKVRIFLEQKRQEESQQSRREQEEALIRLGLWEKEYESEKNSDQALYTETDPDGRRWRKAPIPVTPAEWAEIRRYAGKKHASKWAAALWIVSVLLYLAALWAFVFQGGLLLSLILASQGTVLAGMGRLMDLQER